MRISRRSRTAPFIAMDVLAEAQAIEAARGHATMWFSFAQAPDKIAGGIERLSGFIEVGAGRE